MGILIITAAVLIVIAIVWYCFREYFEYGPILLMILVFLTGGIMCLAIEGDYKVIEKNKYTLGELANASYENNSKYLSRGRDGTITYLKLDKDANGNVTWETDKIKAGNTVLIIENDIVLEPTLTIYESGCFGNFWTFSEVSRLETYVFRLPRSESLPIFEAE